MNNGTCLLFHNLTTCDIPRNWTADCRCNYVTANSDLCEGGGYIFYTTMVSCQDPATRGLLLAGFIIWLLILFLAITVAADAFFSPNIAGIVSYLKISENIAGVTFMAFGNGAPDIFAAMASVVGSDTPKVGLAVGGLVGAGIFVTTVVVGSMMLVKPFEVMRRPLMRDICFYLFSVLFSAFVFLYSDFLYLWETIGFLVIYAIFAAVVISGRVIRQRTLKAKAKRDAKGAAAVAHSLPISTVAGQLNGHPDIINALTRDDTANEEPEWNFEPILASGYFSSIANGGPAGHDRHEDDITKLPPRTQFTAVFEDLLTAVFPIDEDEWQGNFVERIFAIIKAPLILILKLTNPQAGNHWSKALAVIHCFTCPLFAVAAAQQLGLALFDSVPQLQLWMLSLIVSIIPAILVLVFTSFDQEPRFFKPFSSFAGFLMAVFWIHSLANEVVGVLQMVGVVSGLSHEVLGLTLLAWSNSLGDLVADIAVARRGFPKMGISAAFGGPLFNLLLGVGLPFTIAVMRHGGPIPIIFSNVSKVLVAFLALSLASSLVLLLVQRFYAHRWHGAYLLALYAAFLVVTLLVELGVIFNGGPSDES